MASPVQQDPRVGRVVRALTDAGLVDAAHADRARDVVGEALGVTPSSTSERGSGRIRLAEMGGYVGAALVLAAIALLLGQNWGSLSVAAKIGSLTAIAATLAVATVVMATVVGPYARLRADGGARPHLVAVLSVLTAVAAAGAVGVWADQWVAEPDETNARMRLAVWTALFILMAAYWLAAHGIVQVSIAFAAFLLLSSSFREAQGGWYIQVSGTALTIGLVWLVLAEGGLWRERTLGRLIGGAYLLYAAQALAFGGPQSSPQWWAYVATFVVSAVALGLYLWRDDWAYLVVGVVSLTIAVTQTLVEWTKGSLGAGGAVLIAGLTLLATSGVALWLRRQRVAASSDA